MVIDSSLTPSVALLVPPPSGIAYPIVNCHKFRWTPNDSMLVKSKCSSVMVCLDSARVWISCYSNKFDLSSCGIGLGKSNHIIKMIYQVKAILTIIQFVS